MTRRTRQVNVVSKHQLSPNMIRIVLGGNDLADFPVGQESGYVKLLLPGKNGIVKRSYTIRRFDSAQHHLTLDFVVHHDGGPASQWALNIEEGDNIEIDGPGATKLVRSDSDWYCLAGDMTALPAISVNLEVLPSDACGYAVIEVLSPGDRQHLAKPDGIELLWVVNAHPEKSNTLLADKVRSLPWLKGIPEVWVASEFDTMRLLRRYFKQEKQVPKAQVYASSYWKIGETDEGNKLAKKKDVEAD